MSRKKKKLLLASAVFSAGMLAASCGGGGGGGGGGAQAPSPSPTPSPTPTPTVDHVALVQGTDFKVYRVEFRSVDGTMESEVNPTPIGSATANITPIWQFSNRKILACVDAVDNKTLQKNPDGLCDANAGLYLVDGDSVDKLTDGPVWVTANAGALPQVTSRHYNVIQTPAVPGPRFAVFKEDGTVYTRDARVLIPNQQTGGLVYRTGTNEVYAVDPNGNVNKVGISSDLSTLAPIRAQTIARKYLLVHDNVTGAGDKYYVIDTELGSCVGGSCTPIFQVNADIQSATGAVVGNNLYVAMTDDKNKNVHYAVVNLSTGGVSVRTTPVDADNVPGADIAVGGLITADGEGNVYYVSDDGNAVGDDALVTLVNNGTNTSFVATSNDANCYNKTPTGLNNFNLIPFAHNVLLIDDGNKVACQLYVDDAAPGGPALTTAGRNTDFNRLDTYCFGATLVGQQTESVGCLQPGQGFASLKSSSLADLTISTHANAFGATYNIFDPYGVVGLAFGTTVGKNIFATVGNSIYRCNPDDPGLCTLLQNITTGAGGNDYDTFLSINLPIDGKVVGTGNNSGNTVVYFDFVNDERQQLAGLVGFPDLDVFNNKIVGTLGIQSPTSCQWNIAQVWEAGAVKPYTPVNALDTAAGVCAQTFLGFVQ